MNRNGDDGVNGDCVLLTVGAVARLLSVSERSVWRLASSGRIPAPVRVGGSTRWKLADVRAFLDDLGRAGAGHRP